MDELHFITTVSYNKYPAYLIHHTVLQVASMGLLSFQIYAGFATIFDIYADLC